MRLEGKPQDRCNSQGPQVRIRLTTLICVARFKMNELK
jgi:hypothetical protein